MVSVQHVQRQCNAAWQSPPQLTLLGHTSRLVKPLLFQQMQKEKQSKGKTTPFGVRLLIGQLTDRSAQALASMVKGSSCF